MRVDSDGKIQGSADQLALVLTLVFGGNARDLAAKFKAAEPYSTVYLMPNGLGIGKGMRAGSQHQDSNWYLHGGVPSHADFLASVQHLRAGDHLRLAIESLQAADHLNRTPMRSRVTYKGLWGEYADARVFPHHLFRTVDGNEAA